MNQRERNALDRHITGNYGEDQFDDELSDEEIDKRILAYPWMIEALRRIALGYEGTEGSGVQFFSGTDCADIANEALKKAENAFKFP